ncbi:hypothetical protein JTB14_037505 [Gonioctena quinquepunctata]|nr:hypothetical protein JTB14_037505 [Gonioctena quinquepunctata]
MSLSTNSDSNQEVKTLHNVFTLLHNLDEKKDRSNEALAYIKGELMSLKGKITLSEEENKKLTNHVKSLHRILRKHNLGVFGLDNSDISENLLCLSRSLGIELSTSDLNINQNINKNNKRILKIELISYLKKSKSSKTLKSSKGLRSLRTLEQRKEARS